MVRLGLVEPGGKARALGEPGGVFYDPEKRRLYLAPGSDVKEHALLRGVARALHDQHIDRRAFVAGAESTDAAMARWALVEGDAAALVAERAMMRAGMGIAWGDASLQALLSSAGVDPAKAPRGLAALPLALRERVLFPYREGLAFVVHFRRRNAWSHIDSMYVRPPLSTSHILHPERYERYERPYRIEAGGIALDRMYRPIYDDVSGELGIRSWLIAHGVSRTRAERAAAGWGGDRLVVYAPPSRLGGAWPDVAVRYSAWRTEVDALEHFEAAARALPSVLEGDALYIGSERAVYRSPTGEMAWVERRGTNVVLVLGAFSSWADEIQEAIWARWQVDRG